MNECFTGFDLIYISKYAFLFFFCLGAIDITIASMSKEQRCRTDEVHVVGFVPSYLLSKKCSSSLDPVLDPLMTDIEDGFIDGNLQLYLQLYINIFILFNSSALAGVIVLPCKLLTFLQ